MDYLTVEAAQKALDEGLISYKCRDCLNLGRAIRTMNAFGKNNESKTVYEWHTWCEKTPINQNFPIVECNRYRKS